MSWPLKASLTCIAALIVAADAPAHVDEQRLQGAVAKLLAERPGTVDAYVVVAALDADPVFNREAREAGRVLARRFDAEGRTLVLAHDEGEDKAAVEASPDELGKAL